jgi:UDP-N-acetylglucosamine 2-epimerase
LSLMQDGQSTGALAGRCIEQLDGVIGRLQPDSVVVQGDTTTAMAASLAAFYRGIPLVHVEAGLRSGNLKEPWPEELNRRITTLATTLHCAPTRRAADALLAEGVAASAVHVTGNTVVDALMQTLERLPREAGRWARKYRSLDDRRMILVTGHRRESFGRGLENICRAVATLAKRFSDCSFVYPVHLNPNVQEPAGRLLDGLPNVMLAEPADYSEFVWLMDRSTLILTDSGGIQEEAPSLKKPLLVMRNATERPEVVEAGAARLVGTTTETIVAETTRLLTDPAEYRACQIDHNPYGDGHAAQRVGELILGRDCDIPPFA